MGKLRVLVTSAGTSTAIGLIKSLQQSSDVEIFTADINDFVMLPLGAFEVAQHCVVPLATDADNYIAAISAAVALYKIDFVFPIHDEEIRVISQARSNGSIAVGAPNLSSEMVLACTDKLNMGRRCLENGIESPATFNAQQFSEAPFYPVFVKPRYGVGSRGASVIEQEEQVARLDSEIDFVFQEVCERPEVTVDVLSTEFGHVAVSRERLEVKAGVSTKARVWYSPELAEIAGKIAAAFSLVGLFCFQVMKRDGRWFVTDINPRCGGATAMTVAAGINLYEGYFSLVSGQDNPAQFVALRTKALNMPATMVTRYFEEHASVVES
jgi:carbamoyl-phosphate synthase large subunit